MRSQAISATVAALKSTAFVLPFLVLWSCQDSKPAVVLPVGQQVSSEGYTTTVKELLSLEESVAELCLFDLDKEVFRKILRKTGTRYVLVRHTTSKVKQAASAPQSKTVPVLATTTGALTSMVAQGGDLGGSVLFVHGASHDSTQFFVFEVEQLSSVVSFGLASSERVTLPPPSTTSVKLAPARC
jgi:hypothetical protein